MLSDAELRGLTRLQIDQLIGSCGVLLRYAAKCSCRLLTRSDWVCFRRAVGSVSAAAAVEQLYLKLAMDWTSDSTQKKQIPLSRQLIALDIASGLVQLTVPPVGASPDSSLAPSWLQVSRLTLYSTD